MILTCVAARNRQKIHKPPILRSFKVIEFGANREPVYDFPLVINSNVGPYLAPLLRYSDLLAKNRKFCPPSSHLAFSFGVTPLNLWKSFTVPETRVFQAADGEDLVILSFTVFNWSTRVTDRLTDRRTDRQNCDGYDALKAVAAFAR